MERSPITAWIDADLLSLVKQYKITQPRKKLWQICEEALIEYLEKRGISVENMVGNQEKKINK